MPARRPCECDTIELLRRTTPDFIVPDMWSLNSQGPKSSGLCSVIKQRLYETRVHNIDELRQRLLHVWQSLIDDAVDQWSTDLHASVRARGRHFEHTLLLSFVFSVLDELYLSHHA